MVRILASLVVILVVGACRSAGDGAVSALAANLSSQNLNDTRVAKLLFSAITAPSAQPSDPVGEYARGCQAGAVALAESGATWQAMRLSRNRYWGQPELVDFLQDLSRFAATLPGWEGLYLGDMSQPRGGPTLSDHVSHQVGLEADVWMLAPDRLNLSAAERESLSSTDMQRSGGAYVNSNWTPQHEALLRAAASDPRVARIFVFPGAKVEMCDNATGDRSWLNKIRPWYGHNAHFHVRLNCPPGAAECVDQAPIPAGDGCDDARQWVANILNPPPPDPTAEPVEPRGDLTMASLPGICLDVLNAN